MLCRRLGAAGLYGKPQERKGPGKRVRAGAGEGARLRWPEGALPAAPASGWARPGWRRPWRKLLFPFLQPPPPPPPRVTGRTVWERPRSSRLLNAGGGGGGQPVQLKGKPKCVYSCCCDTRFLGEAPAHPGRAPSCSPLTLQDFSRTIEDPQSTGRGEWESVTIIFFYALPPSPPPLFWGLLLLLGKG